MSVKNLYCLVACVLLMVDCYEVKYAIYDVVFYLVLDLTKFSKWTFYPWDRALCRTAGFLLMQGDCTFKLLGYKT